jgi:phosphoribosylcarboxyaminoimidazole (NCAIR) mutase
MALLSSVRIFLFALAVVVTLSPGAYGQIQVEATEDAVKAAFLHRFTSFIEWPAQARAKDSIVIGVLNADGIESELSRYIAARKSPIAVRRIETFDEIQGVHVLFIGARENSRLPKIIASLRNVPVLVVTEAPDGLERGAMINFVTTDRVQFEVAVANAAKAGLHLNARLLSVAIRVRKGERDILWDGHGLLAQRSVLPLATRERHLRRYMSGGLHCIACAS